MTFRSRTLYQLSYNGKTRKTQFRRACQELNGDLPITDALPTELQRQNPKNPIPPRLPGAER